MEKRRLARIHALAEKLRFLPHLSEDERYLYAWSLAATPDERWRRSQNFLRSVRSAPPATLQKWGFAILPLPRDIAVILKRRRMERRERGSPQPRKSNVRLRSVALPVSAISRAARRG